MTVPEFIEVELASHQGANLDNVHPIHAGGFEHRVMCLFGRVQHSVREYLAPQQDAVQVAWAGRSV